MSGFSDEDFIRLQQQLVELRTDNYSLKELSATKDKHLTAAQATVDQLTREVDRLNKTVAKSKKLKDIDALLQQIGQLERKLSSQEQDFHTQNQTVVQELGKVMSENEELQSTVKRLEEQMANSSPLTAATDQPVTSDSDQSTPVFESDPTLSSSSLGAAAATAVASLPRVLERSMSVDGPVTSGSVEQVAIRLSEVTVQYESCKTELQTASAALHGLKQKHDEQTQELVQLRDKLKRKQENFLQLQADMEEQRTQLISASDRTVAQLKDNITSVEGENIALKGEIDRLTNELKELRQSSDNIATQLREKLRIQQVTLDAIDPARLEMLTECNNHLELEIKDLKSKNSDLSNQLTSLTEEKAALSGQMEATYRKMQKFSADYEKASEDLAEAKALAQKRKSLLDDLSIQYQKESEQHRARMLDIKQQHVTELSAINETLMLEQEKLVGLSKTTRELEESQAREKALNERLTELTAQLNDAQQRYEAAENSRQEETARLRDEHDNILQSSSAAYEKQLEEERVKVAELQQTAASLERDIEQSEANAVESQQRRRIDDRKQQSLLKEVRRQLVAERRRADKLQERLEQLAGPTAVGSAAFGLDDNASVRSNNAVGDTGSVSSFSGGSSSIYRRQQAGSSGPLAITGSSSVDGLASTLSAPANETNVAMSFDRNSEHEALSLRLGELQQENWALEERVRHLEDSTSSMADDLLAKQKLIDHYLMAQCAKMGSGGSSAANSSPNSLRDKRPFQKVKDFLDQQVHVVDSEKEQLREVNKKLKICLEETLTKNMSLETSLRAISSQTGSISQ